MTPSKGTNIERAEVRRHCLRTGYLGAILLSATLALPAWAAEQLPDLPSHVEVEIMTPEMHRAELRRALASEVDHEAIPERRKLSGQEREALHRDLRNAMRNVNAERDRGAERKQR